MLLLLQQTPIIVDVSKQPPPAHDISIDTVLGMFALAGSFLLAAAIGCAIVAGAVFLYKRWRDQTNPTTGPSHTRLQI